MTNVRHEEIGSVGPGRAAAVVFDIETTDESLVAKVLALLK